MFALRYLVGVALLWSAAVFANAATLRKRIGGTWKLVSTEQMLADGTWRPNPLHAPRGAAYLIYVEDGSKCAIFPSVEKMNAYCGLYQINEAQGSVSHNIEIKDVPDDARLRVQDIGARLRRYVSVDGDTTKLRTVEPRAGVKEDMQTWKRDN
jgi:hypothetical protein